MAEYIEREYVLKCMDDSYKSAGISAEVKRKVTRWLSKAPAADVRPVVLCRECKHYEIDNGWCEYFDVDRVFGDYCSEGVKREES